MEEIGTVKSTTGAFAKVSVPKRASVKDAQQAHASLMNSQWRLMR